MPAASLSAGPLRFDERAEDSTCPSARRIQSALPAPPASCHTAARIPGRSGARPPGAR